MTPRSLPSLAHALSVAPDLDAALVALGEALVEADRTAVLGLLRYDGRRSLLRDRLTPSGGQVVRAPVDTTIDHLPATVRTMLASGGQFVDLGEKSGEYARLLGLTAFSDGGVLSLRGLLTDGQLSAVLALYEQRRMFGTRTSERLSPAAALFDLGYARFQEREAREEAVATLEDVTTRVHAEYMRKLAGLEEELGQARGAANRVSADDAERRVHLERDVAAAQEESRRASRKSASLEQQLTAAVSQLEQAHVELHRRHETLRQKVRTLYLIERSLRLDNTARDPRALVDGLLALVGDDMQAQRCSLMLRAPEPEMLYLAAARGLAPNIVMGARIPYGKGVAGVVAVSREPLLVQDAAEVNEHPLLRDQYLTTGSFISFPLVYRDELIGVVNLTNRAKRGVFIEEDVERVSLLGLVIALIATRNALPDRLLERLGDG
ncbi:MAG: GAF domain-containing protein [Gemmatimonadaceae bacterium]|nr:GAF domain-containing protein [Gemmatimonadaceae bacterium]